MTSAELARIAAALERLAPPPPAMADPLAHPAYLWTGATLVAARAFQPVPIDLLTGIDDQKQAVRTNLERLAAGAAAHDMLLWGARGMGKSALAKSAVAAVQAAGGALALVEVAGSEVARDGALAGLAALFAQLDGVPRSFLLFIDDLGFAADSPAPRRLRALLDGGAEARPANVRLCVTSNRRHIVPRDLAEEAAAANPRDAADDRLALADRFGLSLGFHALDQDGYLAIIAAYCAAHGLAFAADDALAFALQRGQRSGRVARHYVTDLLGRVGRPEQAGFADI
ncbi:DUF815 domain-containing protein [Sphingomonas changnyeongensis]|uniref:DUF815 domain-containing protein n=1 Tax=Sphingomonas changnyeongensis TaxID=2698679 RepID=A0A7Z2S8D6_9SPHN|nr:DUF815 domain-containing protein [Sphingomonas changnyeongensis]QHL90537.1 DUF815 domain-containing protein [Sphingomonas changnyeongensis]